MKVQFKVYHSTYLDQDLEKNKADIPHLANEKNLGRVEFVQEKVSGKVSWRNRRIGPILEELKKEM
ncbi:hypothetical protein [Dyadobacter fermentans]|uniref:hypothetical protein n=1 Tax=Dyadobacter fermentans TaxID=94254 RepID=UPI001CC14352|nr:hypothetical protein [Dyadobacter fermentans]